MNNRIAEIFECYEKIIKVIEKLGGDCSIEEPASEEEIAEYEKKIGYILPEDYKDWLRLTKGIEISLGLVSINIYMPDRAEEHEDGFMALFFGDDAGFRNYYINLETWQGHIYDDDFGTEDFDSFEELIAGIYDYDVEERLDCDDYGDEWQSVYDELFPEDNK